ncbi:MAG: hypothetical protein N2043_01790 [Ignavibacterium sp.]|nr:hypothetical protein [Ignavibacterium sp.]
MLKSYLIIANYPDNNVHFDKDYAKIIDIIEAQTPLDAFHLFIQKHAHDVYTSQRFYDEVYVMEKPKISHQFSIKEHYGDIAKHWDFPNYGLINVH